MKPQNSLILVEVEEEKEKTTVTGVIIPTTVEDKAISSLRIGTVIAINRKEEEEKDIKVGDEVKADVFAEGETVDVTGTTKGHGYQGNIHKDNQSRGPMAHGSRYHRRPGSLGAIINRVFKGMKLPGRMGGKTVTMQHLQVVKVDLDNNVLLIKGNVPGANKSYVTIKNSVKANTKKSLSKQHNK